MRKLSSFTFLSLNGFYKGPGEDTSWHRHGEEENKYSEEGVGADNILVFGRKTYEMMASFWPTPMAANLYPVVAKGMNKSAKILFSNTLQSGEWQNTQVVGGDVIGYMKTLKATEGKNLTILGSGSLVKLFAEANLIDEFQIMLDPVALGEGTSLFSGISQNLNLKLKDTRVFKSNGVVLLTYTR